MQQEAKRQQKVPLHAMSRRAGVPESLLGRYMLWSVPQQPRFALGIQGSAVCASWSALISVDAAPFVGCGDCSAFASLLVDNTNSSKRPLVVVHLLTGTRPVHCILYVAIVPTRVGLVPLLWCCKLQKT